MQPQNYHEKLHDEPLRWFKANMVILSKQNNVENYHFTEKKNFKKIHSQHIYKFFFSISLSVLHGYVKHQPVRAPPLTMALRWFF